MAAEGSEAVEVAVTTMGAEAVGAVEAVEVEEETEPTVAGVVATTETGSSALKERSSSTERRWRELSLAKEEERRTAQAVNAGWQGKEMG